MVSLIPKNNFYYNNKIKGSQKYIFNRIFIVRHRNNKENSNVLD